MLCPIINIGRKEGDPAIPCIETECAWWIEGKNHAGTCAITRLAHYAAGVLKTQGKIPESLDQVSNVVEGVTAVLERGGLA